MYRNLLGFSYHFQNIAFWISGFFISIPHFIKVLYIWVLLKIYGWKSTIILPSNSLFLTAFNLRSIFCLCRVLENKCFSLSLQMVIKKLKRLKNHTEFCHPSIYLNLKATNSVKNLENSINIFGRSNVRPLHIAS